MTSRYMNCILLTWLLLSSSPYQMFTLLTWTQLDSKLIMISTEAIAKKSQGGDYEKITIQRGWTSEEDVELEVKYSGFCHTDLHIANNDLGITSYPVVPGHEVAGVVTKVGSKVQDLKIGDHVGIGYFIDSCLSCEYCVMDDETNCLKGKTMTAAGAIRFGRIKTDNGKYSYGGFSKKMIANRHFISKIPKSYPLEKAGPCFCAGDEWCDTFCSPFCLWLLLLYRCHNVWTSQRIRSTTRGQECRHSWLWWSWTNG